MFLEQHNMKEAFSPVDLNTAPVVGSRVSMKGAEKVTIAIFVATSLTGGVVDVTLKQHTAPSAGTSKALAVVNPYYKKVGAATSFTKVEPGSALSNYVLSTDFDTAYGVVVFEVKASDLDVNGGFNHVSVELADGGVAKIGHGVYILSDISHKPAYANAL